MHDAALLRRGKALYALDLLRQLQARSAPGWRGLLTCRNPLELLDLPTDHSQHHVGVRNLLVRYFQQVAIENGQIG
jgi:hypothetical protein